MQRRDVLKVAGGMVVGAAAKADPAKDLRERISGIKVLEIDISLVGTEGSVKLDGKEISSILTGLDIGVRVGELNRVTLHCLVKVKGKIQVRQNELNERERLIARYGNRIDDQDLDYLMRSET